MSHEVLHLEIMSYDSTHITRNFCLSCAWKDKRCRIGLILGTGTNACYLEDVKNIETLDDDSPSEVSLQRPF